MSLGFGLVSREQWAKYRQGNRADSVPAGDYVGEWVDTRHIRPSEKNELHVVIPVFTLSEDNEAEYIGKKVEGRFQFDPDPQTDGRQQMNDINGTDLASLVDAVNAEEVSPDGENVDMEATMEAACAASPKVAFTVFHEDYKGRTFQNLKSFRPVA